VPEPESPRGGRDPGHAKIAKEGVLLSARWVVPVEPAGAVLEQHAVAVRDGKIEAVLPAAHAAARFPGYESLVLENHVLMPGLVNAHTHAAMSLLRGLADDQPLMRWLEEHIWPAEAKHVSREFVRDGTLLACAEMIRGGITCFNDMYFFPDASLEAALAAGLRSAQGMIVIEFPSAYAADAADYLRRGLEVRDRNGDESLASLRFELGQCTTELPWRARASISPGSRCTECTAISPGPRRPSRPSRSSGRTPCSASERSTSSCVSWTWMCTGRSSSAARAATWRNVPSETV
jgi:hypothetical protein